MKNRESLYPGRVKLTPVDAANGIYDLIRADEPQEPGTPLNKKLLDFAVAACGVTAGTATAYTLDDEFGGFELVDGACVNFGLHVESGAAFTLNVNGTGAKSVTNARGAGIDSGMPAGTWITARYSKALDKYIAETAPHIISGTYVGDGTGKAEYGISFAGYQPAGFTLTSKTYREILLPFAPTVLYVYVPGETAPIPIYQGGMITADVYFLLSTWISSTGSGNYRSIDSNTDILQLDGNKIKLIGGVSATVTRQSNSEIIRTEISKERYTSISQPPFSEVGGTNVAGVTYSYIAF